MKVFVNAFQLQAAELFSVEAFFASLQERGLVEFEYGERARILAVDSSTNFYCGILLSAKDHQHFVTLGTDAEGNRTVTVRDMPTGEPMADVNFILLHRASGRGLFTAYQGSGGMMAFGNILKRLYRDQATSHANQVIEEGGDDGAFEEEQERKIRSDYRRSKFSLTPIYTNPNFANELRRFSKIRRFEFLEPRVADARFGPVRQDIEKKRSVFVFKRENALDRLIGFLGRFVREREIADGNVVGNLPNGEEFDLPIQPDIYCLAKFEHDDVIVPDNVRLDRIRTIPMIRNLITIVQANEELFAEEANV